MSLKEIVAQWAQPPPETINQLPKGGRMLDYFGHAETTLALLEIDPEWNWEPLGLDEKGLPALDSDGNLWIRLTVLGVTRLGVGDGASMKIRIGDAIRNGAMRFGVATKLWVKDDEGSTETTPSSSRSASSTPRSTPTPRNPPAAPETPFCTECGAEIVRGEKKTGRKGEFRHVECPSVAAVAEAFPGAEPVEDKTTYTEDEMEPF